MRGDAKWKRLWASGAQIETKVVIGGTSYTEISNPTINRGLMQSGVSIGNAVSASCTFSIRADPSAIPKSAAVEVFMRLTTDGTAENTSDWLSRGTYYVSHRSRDVVTGVINLECYDSLLKANTTMDLVPWTKTEQKQGDVITTGTGEPIYFTNTATRSMNSILYDILFLLDLQLDDATETLITQTEVGDEYVLGEISTGTTIHDVLCKIAAAHGGNWIITTENKLKIVELISAPAAGQTIPDSKKVTVSGITGGIIMSNSGTVTGITYNDEGIDYLVGDETGIVLAADVSGPIAQNLYQKFCGTGVTTTYQAYDLQGAVYDPAAELGDYLICEYASEQGFDTVRSVLFVENITLGFDPRGDISAPQIGEIADEYPYPGNKHKVLDSARLYTNTMIAAFSDSLNQQEIFNRLTDGGETQGISLEKNELSQTDQKQIHLNVDYVNNGVMSFKHLRGDRLSLGGENNENGAFDIYDSTGTKVGLWDSERLRLGDSDGSVQLYGPAEFDSDTIKTPFYAQQSYTDNFNQTFDVEMLLAQGLLMIESLMYSQQVIEAIKERIRIGTGGVQINRFINGEETGGVTLGVGALANNSGEDFTVGAPNSDSDLVLKGANVRIEGGVKVNNKTGKTGTFTTANGKTVTVTNGIITNIA